MSKVIIVVDKGHFKAYRMTKNPLESARIELMENYDCIDAHGRLCERVSDKAGRFGMGGERNAVKGCGEPHNMEIENDKRIVKRISKSINTVIKRENCKKWYLAASRTINNQIVANLDSAVKQRLDKNVTADLTKRNKSDILEYFGG